MSKIAFVSQTPLNAVLRPSCQVSVPRESRETMSSHLGKRKRASELDNRYIYEPLSVDGQEIRLVKLIPSRRSRQLCCRLRHTTIGQIPYQALSYVWGSNDKPCSISILGYKGKNLGKICLTLSANNALRDILRTPDIITSSRYLWIDSICINQDDDIEKSHQVRGMGRVFSNAKRVITYLGPNTPHDAAAIDYVEKVRTYFEPNLPILASLSQGLHRALDPELLLPVRSEPKFTCEEVAKSTLAEMAFGEWTQRAWMYQESFLTRNSIFLRGVDMIDWISLGCIPLFTYMWLLPRYTNVDPVLVMDSIDQPLWRRLTDAYPRRYGGVLLARTLQENLCVLNKLGCSDPRDRIYAFLAVSRDVAEVGIIPDYTKSVDEVFLEASIRMLSRGDLYHFHQINSLEHSKDSQLPSWALSTSRIVVSSPALAQKSKRAHPKETETQLTVENGRVLICQGAVYDEIKFTTGTFTDPWVIDTTVKGSDAFSPITSYDYQAICMYAQIFGILGFNSATVSALLSALIPDHSPTSQDATYLAHVLYPQMWEIETSHRIKIDSAFIEDYAKLLSNIESLRPSPICDKDNFHRFRRSFLAASLRKRRLAITCRNNLCNANAKTQVGDVTALLRGLDRPWVLRPVPDTDKYQVVGDIFVPDIMKGEFYDDKDPDVVDGEIRLV